jgi:hypothetical protein
MQWRMEERKRQKIRRRRIEIGKKKEKKEKKSVTSQKMTKRKESFMDMNY